MIASPCTKVCVMNDATGTCRGCFRTLEEIARWSAMTDDEQMRVLEAVTRRRSDAGQAPAQVARGDGST